MSFARRADVLRIDRPRRCEIRALLSKVRALAMELWDRELAASLDGVKEYERKLDRYEER